MNITMLSPRTLLLTPLALLAVLALAALAMFASPTVGQAQGACADPNDASCPFGVTPSATHESITVAWVDQLDGANKWQIEVGIGDRKHLVNVEDTIVWSGGSSRIKEKTVTAEDVGVAKTVSDSYQCEESYVTEEHVGKYMAVCIVTPPTAKVTKSANPFTITNATWPELSIRPETDHTVRMRAFRDDQDGYIVARSGWSTSHTVRTKEEPQPQEGTGPLAAPPDVQVEWVRHAGTGRWNLHMTWTATTSTPASANRAIHYQQDVYNRAGWYRVHTDCRPGESGSGGYIDFHGIKAEDTSHIFCASNGEVDLAPGFRIRLQAVEADKQQAANPSRHSSWVEVKAPAYENDWYQAQNVKSEVTNDYARITWDAPKVTSGASDFLDRFFSVPRRVSYDILIKTAGGTRADNGEGCGSGNDPHRDSRYGRVVTVRTLLPGCTYVAEIEALYSSAITGIPEILGVKAAPGKQLSKGSAGHRFEFTEPQRSLVLKVNRQEKEDGAQVDVSEGSKVTLTADIGGAAPDHGLRIKLVATGTAGSRAGCSTGTGHDWSPGLNCVGGEETANLHIAAGENSASIDIKFHQDAQEDPGETLTLTASYVIRGESDSHSVTFNIEDIYHANKLSVQSSSAREKMPEGASAPAGIDSTKPVRFLVVLQRSTQETVTVKYATADGFGDIVGDSNGPATGSNRCLPTASENNSPNRDYVKTSDTLTFGPGEIRKHIDVEVCDDTIEDSMEVFRMIVSDVTNAMITHPKAIGLIINDEAPANGAPTVVSAIPDSTMVNESGTRQVSLSGVFTDADGDTLAITAKSSDTAIAAVAVATDQSSLTVAAKKRGTATITVTAADGNGGSVEDTFNVTVKAAPVVANAIADVSGLLIGDEHEVSVSGVFRDADSDALTITATSSRDDVAAVAAAAGGSSVTLTAKSRGTATVTVTAQDSDGNRVSDAFDVAVVNRAPTVASAIGDVTIVSESGTSEVSMSGVFTDADDDSLTVAASSSDEKIATASVSADQATLTVTAKARGTTTITVTAADGNGGSVEDAFTVTVKAAPVVASAIADVSELEINATHEVLMSGVFSDADGDALTISAATSDSTVVQVSNTIDPATGSATAITVIGVDAGTATITVTARDSDGNSVSDGFDVTVPAAEQQQAVELPGPVTGLTVTASGEDSATVNWSAPESGGTPDGYIVHLRPEGGKQGSGTTKRPGADSTTVTFKNLKSGRTYEVWVRSQNEAGKGERTNATITLEQQEQAVELPGPVIDLELSATADTVTVSWTVPETGGAPDNYIVHIKPEDGGKGKTKTPKAKKTSATFNNLEAGATYEVWVRAQNEAGKGERVHVSITLPTESGG